jgi:GDP-L-fucose synthase
MDNSKIQGMGWKPKIALKEGLVETYKWYVENVISNKK